MKNFWIYAPGENACHWEEFYQLGIMGLGWDSIGDLNKFSDKENLVESLMENYPSSGYPRNDLRANLEFKNGISIGDIIFVKKGVNQFVGWGVVESEYYYDSNRDYYQKCRRVKWMASGSWPVESNIVMKTLTNITKYTDYVNTLLNLMETNIPNLISETINSNGYNSIKKAPWTNLKIIVNGQLISKGPAKDNFLEFFKIVSELVGQERISQDFSKILKFSKEDYPSYKISSLEVVGNYYLDTHSSTQTKFDYIMEVMRKYKLDATVEIVDNSLTSKDVYSEPITNQNLCDGIEFPSEETSHKIFLYSITDKSLNWSKLNIYKDSVDSQLIYELVDCEEYTYIISDKAHDAIKIGKTKNDPEIRLNQLKTANPSISLIHTFPSSFFSEKELHEKFDDIQKNLEWFFYTKVLQKFITDHRENHSKILESYRKRLDLDKSEREILSHLS